MYVCTLDKVRGQAFLKKACEPRTAAFLCIVSYCLTRLPRGGSGPDLKVLPDVISWSLVFAHIYTGSALLATGL